MPKLTQLNSFSTLRFSGEKTQSFLQGQLTCDMYLLSEHGQYALAACCDHRGRMIANFWVVRWQDDYLFVLPREMASLVSDHLKKFAVFSKVSITPDDSFFIAELNDFTGEKNAAIFITLPSNNRYLIIADKNPFPSIEINSDETHWKKNNITDMLCILYPTTSLLFTPHMIHLQKLGGVSFTKGCYVGQEIVARTEYLGATKRHLRRITVLRDDLAHPGDTLKNNLGETIGVIVEAIHQDTNSNNALAVMHDTAQP